MKDILQNKFFRLTCATIGILTALIPIVGSLINGILHVDEPILLVEMERIAEGYIPYVDMHLNYPPLWFYLMAGLKRLFCIPYGNYIFYHIVHYLFVIADAILIAKICQKYSLNNLISWFSAWLFLLVSHWMSGNAILFEMPSLFFGLLAIWLVQLQSPKLYIYCLIGILTACSFLIKQFGAGFFIIVLMVILLSNNRRKYIIAYIIGYVLPIILCIFIWHRTFFDSVILNGYGTTNAVDGETISLFSWSNIGWICKRLIWFVLRCFPVLLALPLLLLCQWNRQNGILLLVGICGILGFSLQFLLVHWNLMGLLHYYLYIIPFAIFTTACILDKYKHLRGYYTKLLIIILLSVTILLSFYSTYYNRVWKIYLNSNGMKEDIEFAMEIASNVDEGARIWIVDSNKENIYWLANILPPNMKTVGYSTGSLEITKERAQLQIDSAEYVLHCVESDYCIPAFTDSMKTYLNQFKTDTFDDGGYTLLLHNTRIKK